MKIPERPHAVVIGQGYVGLPLSFAALDAGYKVTGIDLDTRKIALLRAGTSPVEDVKDDRIQEALANKTYFPSTDYSSAIDFDFAVITVPTPLRSGQPDPSFIKSAGESLALNLRPGATIILESTTYPGTTEELLLPVLEHGSGLIAGRDFFLGYSPERIDPGNQVWNLLNTPKIVSGIDRDSRDAVSQFYQKLGIEVVPVSGTREAEMSKLLENTFRHVNIALVNELSLFSRHLGVNLWEAIDAAATKPFGFMKFTPGPGVGGHCLPIDPTYLSWAVKEKSGSEFSFVSLANSINSSMPIFVAERASEILESRGKTIAEARILIVGLAYKPDTGDTRESPALAIAEILEQRNALVFGTDSHVSDELWPKKIKRVRAGESLTFDLTIVVTNHSNHADHWAFGNSDRVLDTRNCLQGDSIEYL